jgi:sulfatase modifying factor 1
VILTGSDSSVDLLFENGVVLQVQPNTEFSIDKFQLDPFNADGLDYKNLTNEPTTSVTQMKLDAGTILASSKKLKDGSRFEIITPIGTCGIRGTRFFVQTEKLKGSSTAMVGVAEGLVEFTTSKGQSREVAAGETLGVSETATGDNFTPNPPGATELLPATNAIDGQLRQIVPPKSFEGSEASSQKVSKALEESANKIVPKMIRVDGGKSGEERVKSFEIGKYEVTWGEWREVTNWAANNGYDLANIGTSQSDNHPVEVNWYEAVKWCNAKSEMNRLEPVYLVKGKVYKSGDFGNDGSDTIKQKKGAKGYRLPSLAEWIWAASGGKKSKGCTFSGSNDLDSVGWFNQNSGGSTKPIGIKNPNELGIHDMSGNLWEWCWDLKGQHHRWTFGGGWRFPPESCSISHGGGNSPNSRNNNDGFRLARSL